MSSCCRTFRSAWRICRRWSTGSKGLPVSKLSKLPESAPAPEASPSSSRPGGSPQYRVESRAQAIALLDQVQRFFRHAEPSSPVPMLCDRARAFAERDFMSVLRDVLPKAALKTIGAEKER